MSVEDLQSKLKLLDKEKDEVANQIRRLEPITRGQLEDAIKEMEDKFQIKTKESASSVPQVLTIPLSGHSFTKLSYSEFTFQPTTATHSAEVSVNTSKKTCVDIARLYCQ